MVHVDLPYNYGTFVKAKGKDGNILFLGTVVAYMVTDDGYCIWVSAYKEAQCGEFLPEEVEPMKEFEVEELKNKYKSIIL